MKNLDNNNVETILVVDDEPSIVRLCRKTLNNGGLSVDIATNGKVAQGMVLRKHYALCLLDIRTPEMDGMELFHWLGDKHPEMAERVIFTTGDIISRETVHFIERSGMPFLPKPFTPGELQSVVNDVLKHTRKTGIEIGRYTDFGCGRVTRFGLRVAGVLCNRIP